MDLEIDSIGSAFASTVSVAVIGIGLCAPMLLAWGGNKGAKVKKPSPEEFEENYPDLETKPHKKEKFA